MTLPIYSLENHIPDKIFKRGIDYQSRGLVEDFTETMNIVDHLRELYKRKPALLDELSKG